MSVELVTFDGGELSPKRDAIWRKDTQVDGVIYGCELTHLGSNQVQISAGWLNVRGRLVEVLQETILCELATSGTMDGRIYLKLDLADATTPAELLTVAATTLPDLEQDDDFNTTNGVWEMELGLYTASTTLISDLETTYGTIKSPIAEPLTATITTTWTSGGTVAPFYQDITLDGILADDTPIVDVVLSGTWTTDETRLSELGYIVRIVTSDDSIRVYASTETTVSIPIQVKVVR